MYKYLLIVLSMVISLPCFGQITEKEIKKYDLSEFDNNGDGKVNKTEAAQTISELYTIENNGLTRSLIIDGFSQSKDDLFIAASNWFATQFKLSDSQIQLSDKDSGIIIGKGVIPNVGSTNTNSAWGKQRVSVELVLRVDVKDNKIRITPTITNYIIDNIGKKGATALFGSPNLYKHTKDNSITFINPTESFPFTKKDRKLAEIGLTNGHIAILLMTNNLEQSLKNSVIVPDDW